jgi:hypothetical protein
MAKNKEKNVAAPQPNEQQAPKKRRGRRRRRRRQADTIDDDCVTNGQQQPSGQHQPSEQGMSKRALKRRRQASVAKAQQENATMTNIKDEDDDKWNVTAVQSGSNRPSVIDFQAIVPRESR